jgi:hypothetical protein
MGVRRHLRDRADPPDRDLNYLDAVAERVRQHVPPDVLPEGDSRELFRLYALLALAKGVATQSEDVHNAWAVWMLGRDPSHRSLRPFDELDADTRQADEPFVEAIRAAAGEGLPAPT